MYLIEKIVIKDGVNADTTVTINKYTGEVDAINTLLAHPNIPNTRGIANYSVIANKPTFSFSGVGANEMWIYVNGVGFTPGGITTIEVDQSIKILDYQASETYTMSNNDENKLLVINNDSNIFYVDATSFSNNKKCLILNVSDNEVQINRTYGGLTSVVYLYSGDTVYYYVSSNLGKILSANVVSNNNIISGGVSDFSISIDDTLFSDNRDVTVLLRHQDEQCVIDISSWSKIKREIKIINLGEESASVTLPSGHTVWAMSLPSSIPTGSFLTLFLIEPTKWAFYR